MKRQIYQLHNLMLNRVHFFTGLLGTCAECGRVSLLALLVHLRISPWEWSHTIIHRREFTWPHSTPIVKIYFVSREMCVTFSTDVLTWLITGGSTLWKVYDWQGLCQVTCIFTPYNLSHEKQPPALVQTRKAEAAMKTKNSSTLNNWVEQDRK